MKNNSSRPTPSRPSLQLQLRLSAFLAAVALSAVLHAQATPTPLPTRITAATVYPDRALVTRNGTLELTPGLHEITLENLPASLLDASLQAAGQGTASVTLLDVTARPHFHTATPDVRLKPLEDQLRDLQSQDRALRDQLAALDQQRALLTRIESAATSPAPGGEKTPTPRPTPDEWQRLLTFSLENTTRLATQQQALERQRTDLSAQLQATENQLAQLRSQTPANRATKTITLRVNAANSGTFNLALTYALPGASWTPAYDARLRSETRALDLTYHGLVRNATGEDWRDIALTLSTARPSLGGAAPELTPWIVGIKDNEIIQLSAFEISADSNNGYAAKGSRADKRIGALNLAAAPAPIVRAELAQATVQTAATSATFRIATPATLLSDNTAQKLPITTATLPAALLYQITPRLQETAYLSTTLTNTTEFPFLAGTMNTFLGDTFVATSALKTVMPGEKFDLSLGADETITVKRRALPRSTENTGFTNTGLRYTYETLVTLTNRKKTSERITLRDHLPVSRHEKIVVKLLAPAERDLSTAEKTRDITRDAEGKFTWTIDLKPGETREVPFKFTVEHPADLPLAGLE